MLNIICIAILVAIPERLTAGFQVRYSRPSQSGGIRRWAFEKGRHGIRLLGVNVMWKRLRFSYDAQRDVMKIEDRRYSGDFFRFMSRPDPSRVFRFYENGSGVLVIDEVTNPEPPMILNLNKDGAKRFLESHGVLTVDNVKGKHNRDLNKAIRENKTINRFTPKP